MVKKCIAFVKIGHGQNAAGSTRQRKAVTLCYGLKLASISRSFGICYCGGNVDNGMVSDLSKWDEQKYIKQLY